MESKKYFLGLDIGTDSVGYAVTDKEYSLLKYHGEPMWGVTMFDEASLGTDRRSFRTARRRLDRRQQRIRLIQELFAPEIGKIDERFFIRMQSSALFPEDCGEIGSIFNSEDDYSDASYHKDYPTIHHLIYELMTSTEMHDVRLVYLACAWLVAHRGHFLNEINVDNIERLTDFTEVYNELIDYLTEDGSALPWNNTPDISEKFGNIIKENNTISAKYKKLCTLLFNSSKAPKSIDGINWSPETLLKLLCGSTSKASDLFGNDEYSEIESFSLNSDDEKLAGIMSQLGDDAALIEKLKAVFDWTLLVNIIKGEKSLSAAKVEDYNRHKQDLETIKKLIHKYKPEKFNEIFRDIRPDNYVAYTSHCKKSQSDKLPKKVKIEDFSKYLLQILKTIVPDESDEALLDDVKKRLETQRFLPKQKTGDNRVIPHQLYQSELNKILENAEKYLPFLSTADENGLTVSDKIRSVFVFRVPYYVGPLNPSGDNAWVRFKSENHGRIFPWNFSDIVDEDASEQAFIDKLINYCTYLPDKVVLPKDSLLYHKFTVLNEINNIKISGVPISVETKQEIYNEVFLRYKKVTVKKIRDYLVRNNKMGKDQTIEGIDETIKSDLRPWHDFKRLMESGTLTEQQVEEIIAHRTYSEEKTRFVKWLRENYAFLPKEDLQYISKLNYKDFGRLSREFLTELYGTSKTSPDGEAYSIIHAMWETNNNLMELLSDKYTFHDAVIHKQNEYYGTHTRTLNERLDDMYISNSVKRSVIRSLEIVKEVVKAVGAPPEKIFIEMTRGGEPEQKGKRTKSRKDQILELYENCKSEDIVLLKQQLEELGEYADNRLQEDALFLYFMQLGKCMYSGEAMDIGRLKDGTYNIEHIYPQAYVKDDSIINNKVLVKSKLNEKKEDTYPIGADIRHKMAGFWALLHNNGLIRDEKYKRLTRSTPFSDEEKLNFINRQLTETSQSTKAVASLLSELYPEPETQIKYVKARLTSEFRQKFDLLKSRTFNDLHHAKDAYLNIVTGNVYDMKFSRNWFSVDKKYSVKTKPLFTHPLICGGETVWDGQPMLEKAIRTVSKNNAHMTKYAFCRHGGFFDQMPVKADDGLIPLKKNMPTEKYGGYNKPAVTCFILAKYRIGKKTDIMVMPVELLKKDKFFSNADAAAEYAKEKIGQITNKVVDEVSFPLGMRILKVNTILSLDGFRICLSGSAGGGRCIIASPFMPFVADSKWNTYMKRIESLVKKVSENPKHIYDEEYDMVSKAENEQLYNLYIDKLTSSIYRKRPNNPLNTIVSGKETFESLTVVEQAKALASIHQVFGRVSGGCDLSLIGGASHSAATVSFSSMISNWKKSYSDVRIIDSSASGLWEKQSGNLLDLL